MYNDFFTKRKQHIQHYLHDVPCTYSLNVEIDITSLLNELKSHHLKLYPALIFGLSQIVNRHEEFRIHLNPDQSLAVYPILHPLYTIFHPQNETFSCLWSHHTTDFLTFYRNYLNDLDQYGQSTDFSAKPDVPENVFNISCLPWVSFTGFQLNIRDNYTYLQPIFTFGKYHSENDRIQIPLAIQVHHAACDGFHTARLVQEFQKWADEFRLTDEEASSI